MNHAMVIAALVLVAGCAVPLDTRPAPYYEEVLSAEPFTDLIVEVDHAPGRAPSLAARDHLLQELRNVTSKARITIKVEQTLPADASKRWTADELVQLERDTRSTRHAAPVAVLHVLYPAGEYERPGVAGVTVSGPVIGPVVVFLDTLDDLDFPLLGEIPLPPDARAAVERATLLHEAGHAMGLVDNGLPMVRDREDKAHEGHSTNEASVMYWQVESLAGLREMVLGSGEIPLYFDEDDRADMRAAGGR